MKESKREQIGALEKTYVKSVKKNTWVQLIAKDYLCAKNVD
jgi:hypothetical protein